MGAIVETAVVDVAIGVEHLAADDRSIADPSTDDRGTPTTNNGPAATRGEYAARGPCATVANSCTAHGAIASDTVVDSSRAAVG